MLTVDHFAEIRRARRDGLTIRQITLKYGHSPKTVLKALKNAEPLPYTRARPGPRVFGPFQAIVNAMLMCPTSRCCNGIVRWVAQPWWPKSLMQQRALSSAAITFVADGFRCLRCSRSMRPRPENSSGWREIFRGIFCATPRPSSCLTQIAQ